MMPQFGKIRRNYNSVLMLTLSGSQEMRDTITNVCLCNLISFTFYFYYFSVGENYLFQQIKAKT